MTMRAIQPTTSTKPSSRPASARPSPRCEVARIAPSAMTASTTATNPVMMPKSGIPASAQTKEAIASPFTPAATGGRRDGERRRLDSGAAPASDERREPEAPRGRALRG